jgi:hypothetical protein
MSSLLDPSSELIPVATAIDPMTMKRLAFIRMLHQQGVEQSHLPQPLQFTSVLSFHDAAELFLVLACEYLGAPLQKDRTSFMQYWTELAKCPNGGVNLSPSRSAMSRLHEVRNNFKHSGALPGADAVEQARSDVASFLETSTPLVFDGLAYANIDMADVITQVSVRAHVKAAAIAAADGDRITAMARLAQALEELVRAPGATRRRRSPFSLGPDLHYSMSADDIGAVLWQKDQRGPTRGAQRLGNQLSNVTEAVEKIQAMLRVTALGLSYGQYLRFRQLTPQLHHQMGALEPTVHHVEDYAPSQSEVDYCQQFVITASLRVAEVTAHLVPSSWVTAQ